MENFEWPYLRKGSCYPLMLRFYGRVFRTPILYTAHAFLFVRAIKAWISTRSVWLAVTVSWFHQSEGERFNKFYIDDVVAAPPRLLHWSFTWADEGHTPSVIAGGLPGGGLIDPSASRHVYTVVTQHYQSPQGPTNPTSHTTTSTTCYCSTQSDHTGDSRWGIYAQIKQQ